MSSRASAVTQCGPSAAAAAAAATLSLADQLLKKWSVEDEREELWAKLQKVTTELGINKAVSSQLPAKLRLVAVVVQVIEFLEDPQNVSLIMNALRRWLHKARMQAQSGKTDALGMLGELANVLENVKTSVCGSALTREAVVAERKHLEMNLLAVAQALSGDLDLQVLEDRLTEAVVAKDFQHIRPLVNELELLCKFLRVPMQDVRYHHVSEAETGLQRLQAEEASLASELNASSAATGGAANDFKGQLEEKRAEVEQNQKELRHLEAAQFMYGEFITSSRNIDTCQCCHRAFGTSEARQAFNKHAESLAAELPKLIEEQRVALCDEQTALRSLEAVRPRWERLEQLRQSEIPQRQKQLTAAIAARGDQKEEEDPMMPKSAGHVHAIADEDTQDTLANLLGMGADADDVEVLDSIPATQPSQPSQPLRKNPSTSRLQPSQVATPQARPVVEKRRCEDHSVHDIRGSGKKPRQTGTLPVSKSPANHRQVVPYERSSRAQSRGSDLFHSSVPAPSREYKIWTTDEEQRLIEGVREYGKSWGHIRDRLGLAHRNSVQLKDKWRNLEKYGRV